MEIKKLNIKGLLLIKSKKNKDNRGWFQETYHLEKLFKKQFKFNFVQDNLVYSKKNVLRGLHFQKKKSQGKLISCIKGKIFDVAVDLRKESTTYRSWVGYALSEDDDKFIYIPPGLAHGYFVESNGALVHYKCTNVFNRKNEIGIIWNDTDINIAWPKADYILSGKDQSNKSIKKLNL